MDITNTHSPAPATRPCALPHSAPAAWLRSAEPAPEPEPDPKRELQDAIHYHITSLEDLSEQLNGDKPNRGGWDAICRRLFLSTLASTGQVSKACEIVDLSKQSAYALRARDPIFAAGWNAAAELARDALADQVLERAIEGSTETVRRNGEIWAERHRFDGRLAMAVLNRLDRRCDRSAAEGGAHVRALADWDRFLDLVGGGDDGAARDLLDPPEPVEVGQPSQVEAPEEETVWRDSENRGWRTTLPHPGGMRVRSFLGDGRQCTTEEAALLDEYFGSEEVLAAEREAERAAYFAELRAELDEEEAALAGEDCAEANVRNEVGCGPLLSPEENVTMTDQNSTDDRGSPPRNQAGEQPPVPRDPHADNQLIDEMAEESLGSGAQQGRSGGNLQRRVATRDELKNADRSTTEPTSVHKGDYPDGGASPNPRDGTDLGGS